MRSVTSLDHGEITSAPVDPTALRRRPPAAPAPETPAERAADAVTGPLADHAPAAKSWAPPLAGRSFFISLEPPKREPINLELRVEPVWNLRRSLITSFLVDRRGAPAKAEPVDLEEIDAATLAYVSTLLAEHAAQGGSLTLHVPISFASLATQRSRERLIRQTRPVREAMRTCWCCDRDRRRPGRRVPPSRLIEVVGLVRSLRESGALGRARPSKAAFAAVRGCGLRGVVAEGSVPARPVGERRSVGSAWSRPMR